MTVFDLKRGQSATVTAVNLSGGLKARLSSLGIKSGERVSVLGFSVFKSSVLIACSCVRVAVRRAQATQIEVRV